MIRWLPHPLLSLALLTMWLLMNQTMAAAHVLLGLALGFVGGRAYAALRPPQSDIPARRSPLRRALAASVITGVVLRDIVRSNIAVARIVLRRSTRGQTSGFVDIPLDLRAPAGLAVLACIITATPGTSWARYRSDRGVLTIHVLDLIDDQAWVRTIKGRYERRLLEIFQ